MADKNANEESTLDLSALKEQLLKHKARLLHDMEVKERQIAEDGDDLVPERGGVGNHMADDANETAEQETMLTLQNKIQQELEQVNQALARMEAGTYGTCANCGRPISPARLEARPFSIYCIDCQQLADRGRL
jgi:RNA polymerase-binding protein DksA